MRKKISSLLLSIKKTKKIMKHCLQSLGKNFTVKECSLGTDPHEVLPKEGVYEHVKDVIPQKGLVYKVENVFVLAVDRDAYDDYGHNRLSIEIPLDIK